MSHLSNDYKRTVCEQLGGDLDEEVCEEVAQHLKDCPDCRAQYDTVTQTVKIYRRTHPAPDQPPSAVQERLYRVLNISPRSA